MNDCQIKLSPLLTSICGRKKAHITNRCGENFFKLPIVRFQSIKLTNLDSIEDMEVT